MSKKFTKDATVAHIKTWEDYQEDRLRRENFKPPILLPIYVGIDEAGEIVRNRIKANKLGALFAKAIENAPVQQHDRLKNTFEDYVDFFGSQDKNQSGFPPSPLDFNIKMPVIFMFVLSNKNWTFTGNKQFSTENDNQANPTVKQVCSFGGMRGILIESNNKAEERIKYNLHVTISQYVKDPRTQERKLMTTDIIIDPGMDNDDRGGEN